MASLVDDIERIEANSYNGVGVIKVYLHEGADVSRAVSQLGSSAQVVLKYMPRNITPPLMLRYGATDVPIIQLSLSSTIAARHQAQRLRPEHHPPGAGGGAGGVGAVSVRRQAARDHGGLEHAGAAVQRAVAGGGHRRASQTQNVIAPSGDVKMGNKDYAGRAEQQPRRRSTPSTTSRSSRSAARTVFLRDVAYVHDGYQVQTNSVSAERPARRPDDGPQDRRRLHAVGHQRRQGGAARHQAPAARRASTIKPIFDQSIFVKAALNSVLMGGLMAAGLTALMILLFLGNWRLTLIILASIPLSIIAALLVMYCRRADAQHHDARRVRPGGRHPGRQRHRRHRKHRAEPRAGQATWCRRSRTGRRRS